MSLLRPIDRTRGSRSSPLVPLPLLLLLALAALAGPDALTGAATLAALDAAAVATPGQPLPLEEAVRLARLHNPMVLESRANRGAASAARSEVAASRWPTLAIRETAVRTDGPADVFGMRLQQERFSFPAFVSSDPNQPDVADGFATELEVRAPVFTGGRIRSGIRQAGRMVEAATRIEEHTTRSVDLAVAGAYLDALLADSALALATRARDTTSRHVARAQDLYDAGMMVESDLLQARAQLAQMEEGVIRARNQSVLARTALAAAIGVDPATVDSLLVPSTPPIERPATLESAIQTALSRRADLRAMQARVDAAGAGIAQAQGEYFPSIGVAGRFSLHDVHSFGSHGRSFALVAQAEWSLWNGGATAARVRRSRQERSAAEEARRAQETKAEIEVRQAWNAIEEAEAREKAAADAVAASSRALAILEDRFEQGVAPMTDLLDAEMTLHEARVRNLQARFDRQRSIRTLSFAMGASPVPEA
ncbi:MAG: TolC family protein [Candidatus Eisenbacteria bacterium]